MHEGEARHTHLTNVGPIFFFIIFNFTYESVDGGPKPKTPFRVGPLSFTP